MSNGFRVWDSSGNITLDITDRISRIHGVYPYSVTNVSSQEIPVPGITNNGDWIVFANEFSVSGFYSPAYTRISGGSVFVYASSLSSSGVITVYRV